MNLVPVFLGPEPFGFWGGFGCGFAGFFGGGFFAEVSPLVVSFGVGWSFPLGAVAVVVVVKGVVVVVVACPDFGLVRGETGADC